MCAAQILLGSGPCTGLSTYSGPQPWKGLSFSKKFSSARMFSVRGELHAHLPSACGDFVWLEFAQVLCAAVTAMSSWVCICGWCCVWKSQFLCSHLHPWLPHSFLLLFRRISLVLFCVLSIIPFLPYNRIQDFLSSDVCNVCHSYFWDVT